MYALQHTIVIIIVIGMSSFFCAASENEKSEQACPYKLLFHQAIYFQHEAVFNDSVSTLPTIINTVDLYDDPSFGDTPLHVAMAHGTESMIHTLLACKELDMLKINKQYKNALHVAIECKRPKALLLKLLQTWQRSEQQKTRYKYYLDRCWCYADYCDAFINQSDKEGMTPFHHAFKMQFADGMDALLHYGARTNVRDMHGCMPLNEMVKKGDYAWVSKMANHRNSIKAQDEYGRTPLHYALIYAKNSALPYKLCIESEKLAEIQDRDGKTPLHWVAMLHVADGPSLINSIAGHNHCGINIRDKSGHTPLHKAIIHNNYDPRCGLSTIPTLIKHGASLDEPDADGNTPLELARRFSPELVSKLIEWGAKP